MCVVKVPPLCTVSIQDAGPNATRIVSDLISLVRDQKCINHDAIEWMFGQPLPIERAEVASVAFVDVPGLARVRFRVGEDADVYSCECTDTAQSDWRDIQCVKALQAFVDRHMYDVR
jgi:hypothetical protein